MKRTDAKPPAKSRGRPRQAQTDEREMRRRIVAAARKLFLRDGVEAVSMRNLAAEVGCSPMWLYRYFGNKQQILAQVWDVFLQELFARLERIEAESPRQRLEQLAYAYLDYWLAQPEHFLIVFLQRDLAPGGTRDYVQGSGILERFNLFTRVIDDALAQGELAGAEPAEIAQGLLCLLQGLALNLITLPDYPWADAGALGRLTVKSYLSGLAAARA